MRYFILEKQAWRNAFIGGIIAALYPIIVILFEPLAKPRETMLRQ